MDDQPAPIIVGPDPALLSGADLVKAAAKFVGLAQRVAGTPGEQITNEALALLDRADRYFYEALVTMYWILAAEAERRANVDVAGFVSEVETWLQGETS